MSNEITIIEQREVLGKDFKIYGTLEDPLFLAQDVANWIEHSKASIMLEGIDDSEKLKETLFTSGQNREMWFVTEDGLYEILMQSRKPIAKQFKKQVKLILKTIRITGHYETPEYKVMLELVEKQDRMEKLLIDSGVIRTNVNPRYTFDRLNVRYKIATRDDGVRGFYDSIANYFGICVPYSTTINVTVKDWILANVNMDEIQAFVLGIETSTIVKSLRGYYVNRNGFGGNNIEWAKILASFGEQCAYCGAINAPLIPEHIVCQSYLSQFAPEAVDLIGNIVCACQKCNKSKDTHDVEEWYPKQSFYKRWRLDKIHKHQAKYKLEV